MARDVGSGRFKLADWKPVPDAISSAYEAATVDIPLRVLDLIDRFAALRKTGDEKGLNETTIRETFLNPLLEELG